MPIEQAVALVLDQAMQALTVLDLSRLERLDGQLTQLANSNDAGYGGNMSVIVSKQWLLKSILQNCRSNLNARNRIDGRNTRDQWAHSPD